MKSKVVIYSTRFCAYCVRAKTFFTERSVPFEEVDLTDSPAELESLKRRTGHASVPQIFVDNVFVGGYSDLISKHESGELKFSK